MGAVEIGALLRGARCAARLTQAEVGQACGYSASAVSQALNQAAGAAPADRRPPGGQLRPCF
jgi:transcriptional regulator with XRE-family HTH domain